MRKAIGSIVALALKVLAPIFNKPSWATWLVLLKAMFALPLTAAEHAVFCRLTGRTRPPARPVREAWLIVGRRGGKTMIAALIAVYSVCCRTYTLAAGEVGVFVLIAADRAQARVLLRYVKGILHVADVLRPFIARETQWSVTLTNGLTIEIQTASFRTIRGYTVVGAVCDEIAFWRTDEGATNPDSEILNALRPAMLTVPEALLVVISTPYAKRGELWRAYRDHYGRDQDTRLVVVADTATMNPTVPADEIAAAYATDPVSAGAELGANFRDDISTWVPREAIEAAVVPGRLSVAPKPDTTYVGSLDLAGGGSAESDPAAAAVAHNDMRNGRLVQVLDALLEIRPPFRPSEVCAEFAAFLKPYGVVIVEADRWAGQFPVEQMAMHGITVWPSERTKSDCYRELLPRLTSGTVELLDIPRLHDQLAALERRIGRSGREIIDHPEGKRFHDDAANAAALALVRLESAQSSGGVGRVLTDWNPYSPTGVEDAMRDHTARETLTRVQADLDAPRLTSQQWINQQVTGSPHRAVRRVWRSVTEDDGDDGRALTDFDPDAAFDRGFNPYEDN